MDYLEAINKYVIKSEYDLNYNEFNEDFDTLIYNNSRFRELWSRYQYDYSDFINSKIGVPENEPWAIPFFQLIIIISLLSDCYVMFKQTKVGPHNPWHDNCINLIFSISNYGSSYDLILNYYKDSESIYGKAYKKFKKDENILARLMLMYRWTCCVQW